MASWEHRAYKHTRIGKYLFQINLPKNQNIHEFEVVAFENGTIKSRATFWDSYESHDEGIDMIYSHLVPEPESDHEAYF